MSRPAATFAEQDVIDVAKALVEIAVTRNYDGNGPDYYQCACCYAREHDRRTYDVSKFSHELDCAVLKARDLLTGEAR